MVIDLAHASPTTVRQVLELSSAPVVFSHTGVAATCDNHGRNLDDQTLRRLAANRGVAGIALFSGATCGNDLLSFFRSLEHAIAVAGINHVGLGSDFDGGVATPIDAAAWVLVTDGLLARGYSRTDIYKIMGGNVLRLLRETLPEQNG